jgi:glycosyltransferase involved in cell wall biosynthesis
LRVKVLRIHNAYREPGGEDAAEALETALLRDAGHDVIEYRRESREIDRMGWAARATLPLRAVHARDSLRALRALVARERPEIAHFTNTFPLISPAAYRVCAEAGVAVVQSLHNYRLLCPAATLLRDGEPCERCITHSLFEGVRHACYQGSIAKSATVAGMLAYHRARGTFAADVDLYLALSEFARGRFVAGGLPAERIRVKANFVAPDPLRGCAPTPAQEREHLLFAGRLVDYKAPDLALRACAALRDAPPLWIAGEGPAREASEARARELGARAEFRGALAREALFDAMRGAIALVFPSRWYEVAPLVILEAFACGVPVIAADRGGLSELVRDGHNGLLFRAGDACHLAERLEWLLAHPDTRSELGRNARRDFETLYSEDPQRKQLEDLYGEAIATAVVRRRRAR